MAYEDLQSLDFSDIYGAGIGSSQGLSKIIQSLFGTLATAGHMGTQYQTGGTEYGTDILGSYGSPSDWGLMEEDEYNLDNVIKSLEESYGEEGISGAGLTDEAKKGMGGLLDLLKQFKKKDVIGGYRQDMSSISEEIGAGIESLTKGLGTISKGSRYGKVGTGGRQFGQGSRQDYLNEYFALTDQQRDMQQNLQEKTQEQFMGNIGQWLQYNPST
jgi:hypothetical protein